LLVSKPFLKVLHKPESACAPDARVLLSMRMEVLMMRAVAAASLLTDVGGNNDKARI
jgi:hypothetical protein